MEDWEYEEIATQRILDWYDFAYDYAVKMTGDYEGSKDYVQLMAERIYKSRIDIQNLGEQYITKTIKSVVIDEKRRRFNKDILSDDLVPYETAKAYVDRKVINDLMIADIRKILTAEEFSVISLAAEGLTWRQIAAELDESLTKSRIAWLKLNGIRKAKQHFKK